MEVYSTLSSIFTVVSFCIFAGIVYWAWSARRKASFDAAAVEPFALPDEAGVWNPQTGAKPPHDSTPTIPKELGHERL